MRYTSEQSIAFVAPRELAANGPAKVRGKRRITVNC
jgi:hypothetical protein